MKRLVSVVVPCRNEASYVDAFLNSLLSQVLPEDLDVEILIADGASNDGTRQRLEQYRARHPRICILNNPKKIVSGGLNLAIARARGEIIIRMDVHAEYASDYIAQCVAVLDETKAANVGGPARTRADGYVQRANSLAYHSPFSCGGARFHNPDYEGPVDTVTFGCWRKRTLDQIGLFDEKLVRNQDDELNLRITKAGGTIWQTPRIRSWYKPRSSLCALFRQYGEYGYWKVQVMRKHRSLASLRHLVPALFVGSLALLAGAAPFSSIAARLLLLLVGLYALANAAATLVTCSRPKRLRFLPILPLVFATYHLAYGYGFLRAGISLLLEQNEGAKLRGTVAWGRRDTADRRGQR